MSNFITCRAEDVTDRLGELLGEASASPIRITVHERLMSAELMLASTASYISRATRKSRCSSSASAMMMRCIACGSGSRCSSQRISA